MKILLRILLLLIVVINYSNCTRRVPRHKENGIRSGQEVNTIQPYPQHSNNTAQVNPVIPKTVDKTKPNIEQIKQDLVGHSLSEGVDDGYYSSDWHWTIREGEVSNFYIDRVITESSNEYEIHTRMRLTSSAGKAFDAKVRIRYLFSQAEGWYIQFVQSQGMHIVRSGNYDDCIHSFLDKGWATSTFWIENNCEIALEVGGKCLENGEWKKFSMVVDSHDRGGRSWVNDGRIDYVEIP